MMLRTWLVHGRYAALLPVSSAVCRTLAAWWLTTLLSSFLLTHATGTVFARWNNGANTPVGVVGRALGGSCGCAVRNPQTPEERRSMEGFCLISCLRFAADRGVRVINLSWGGPVPTRATVDDPFPHVHCWVLQHGRHRGYRCRE
jgi:hypothetical protein